MRIRHSMACQAVRAHAAGSLARSLAAHVTGLGMKLDLGDKAFLMASSGDLLVAAKAAMGELGGSAVQAVRKLGVDYAISVRGKKNRKVRAARAASGRARWRRLCKLGLKNQGTRLVYAGILPPGRGWIGRGGQPSLCTSKRPWGDGRGTFGC